VVEYRPRELGRHLGDNFINKKNHVKVGGRGHNDVKKIQHWLGSHAGLRYLGLRPTELHYWYEFVPVRQL
jgi:hypothetical protein